MNSRTRNIVDGARSVLFSLAIHGVLIAAIVVGTWWPFADNNARLPAVNPIQAQVISEKATQDQADKRAEAEQRQIAENKRKEEEKQKAEAEKKREEEEKRKAEAEKKREEEKKRKAEAEKKRKEEEKRKAEAEKKREEEKKRKAEAEKKRKEEKKRKAEAEKKRKEEEKRKAEAEKKRKAEEEKKRKEAEQQRQREQALKKQLEAEEAAQVRADADRALIAFGPRIDAAIEREWIRPSTSRDGLSVTLKIQVSRTGEVLSVQVVTSSGDSFFDRSAEVATRKASPLPFPDDPRYYERINTFEIRFRPDDG